MPDNPWEISDWNSGRLRVRLDSASAAPRPAAQLTGRPWHFAASSPIHTVEWKWPLSIGFAPGSGSVRLRQSIRSARATGDPWMRSITRIAEGPNSDILFIASGAKPIATLKAAPVPLTCDLLILCGVGQNTLPSIAACSGELLALAQAHAILAVAAPAADTAWFWKFIEELSHNLPVDVAVSSAAIPGAALWSTEDFLRQAVLSNFVDPLKKRILKMAANITFNRVDMPALSACVPGRTSRLPARNAVRLLNVNRGFLSESSDASVIAELASAAPEPLMAEPPTAGAAPEPPPPTTKPQARYLLQRLQSIGRTRTKPESALEAGKSYGLDIKIGPKEKGWKGGKESFPAPPIRPEESGVSLVVVFTEPNSCPDGALQTIFLPRTGASSECRFEFTASPASNLFEGWISVYHNNRLLQEGVLRSEVVGGAAGPTPPPAKTDFQIGAMPRPLSLPLRDAPPAAGAIRIEDAAASSVRGLNAARVALPGIKAAVDAISAEFDTIKWETLRNWTTDKSAARGLARIAQLGYQLRQALVAGSVMKQIALSDGPLVVNDAGSATRVPIELCYEFPQPKSTAKVCPKAIDALKAGACRCTCEDETQDGSTVCPLGFWGLRRVIEWHSLIADSRADESIEVTNEPVTGRETLTPLISVLHAQSERIPAKAAKKLATALKKAKALHPAANWTEWTAKVSSARPSMLLLMPHVDHTSQPPVMEIQHEMKDPPGIDPADVVAAPPQQPLVLLLGCGAAHARIDFMSLPAQFRRNHAALVIAPIAELLDIDAPELARIFIETIAACRPYPRPAGEVLLETKRKALAEDRLAGLLLLAAGDATWLLAG